jgi:hypothetical protein
MRRTLTLSLATLALMGLAAHEDAATPEPRLVNIVGACTSTSPRVSPSSITVNRADEVQWRDPSGQAASFTIEPKVPGEWPFTTATHAAARGEAAATGQPGSSTLGGAPVQQGQIYPYKVTIVCPTGDPRLIEADIAIGEM